MNRGKVVVGLLAVLAAVAALGFALSLVYYGRDSCLDTSTVSGSCPALAVVNGERYTISAASVLPVIAERLTEFGTIAVTNSLDRLADMKVYSVEGIDPSALLIGNAADPSGETGRYVVLFGPEAATAWPAFCDYVPVEQRVDEYREHCSAPA